MGVFVGMAVGPGLGMDDGDIETSPFPPLPPLPILLEDFLEDFLEDLDDAFLESLVPPFPFPSLLEVILSILYIFPFPPFPFKFLWCLVAYIFSMNERLAGCDIVLAYYGTIGMVASGKMVTYLLMTCM